MKDKIIYLSRKRSSFTSLNTVVMLSFLLIFMNIPVGLTHTEGPFSAYTTVAPTIDGTLTYGDEWSNAYLVNLNLGDGYTGWLYIMNDATSLYFGLEIVDDDLDAGDLFILVFDSNHNGISKEDGDDDIVVKGDGTVQDNFFQGGSLASDEGDGGTLDVVGAAAASGGRNYFEISHPFNNTDDAHDLNMAVGSTVGFMFQYYDQGAAIVKQWPSDLPAAEADLTISSAPSRPPMSARASGPVTIDGVIGGDEWATAEESTFSISTYTVTLHIMNDASNLYIAANVSDSTLSATDVLTIQFDNNNDGLGRGTGDDQIAVRGDGTFQDVYYTTTGPGLSGQSADADSGGGGTTDGLGAISSSGGNAYFEMMHPLNSADDAHDFSLNIGSKVGFFVVYQDEEGAATGYNRYWPSFQPSAMVEYTVADKITPSIMVSFTPGTVNIGTSPPETGEVSAVLKDGMDHPIPDKMITLSYSKDSPSGPWTSFTSGSTNSSGQFSSTFSPPSTGSYYFKAEVASNENLNAGSVTSEPNSMTVISTATTTETTTTETTESTTTTETTETSTTETTESTPTTTETTETTPAVIPPPIPGFSSLAIIAGLLIAATMLMIRRKLGSPIST